MDKVELYRQVFVAFRKLCAEGRQPSSFRAYCNKHGVVQSQMHQVLKGEFQNVKTLPGYKVYGNKGLHGVGKLCASIYEDFKRLCAVGEQPGTFTSYCKSCGVTFGQMDDYMRRNNVRVSGLPGYSGPRGVRNPRYKEVPFEDVIFEEAGFLPADSGNAITVKVDGHVAVSFPADTDVAVVAKFIRQIRKGDGYVGT